MPAPLHTRAELLECLSQTFRRYGYEGASMIRIAESSGLGKASLYHHFPGGKAQMGLSVIEMTREWFEREVFHPLEGVQPPRQRLSAMLAVLKRYYQDGQLPCLCGVFALCEERTLFGEPIRVFYLRWLACLTQVLADSGLARDIAKRRAEDALERVQGAVLLCRSLGETASFSALTEDLPDQLLAGADRANIWTTRTPRFPSAPMAPATASALRHAR